MPVVLFYPTLFNLELWVDLSVLWRSLVLLPANQLFVIAFFPLYHSLGCLLQEDRNLLLTIVSIKLIVQTKKPGIITLSCGFFLFIVHWMVCRTSYFLNVRIEVLKGYWHDDCSANYIWYRIFNVAKYTSVVSGIFHACKELFIRFYNCSDCMSVNVLVQFYLHYYDCEDLAHILFSLRKDWSVNKKLSSLWSCLWNT